MKEIKADVITIGDEILYGQTVDTNSAFIGKELNKIGISIKQITSISDDKDAIINSINSSTSDIILITGGLGPTLDDITKQTLCEYFDDELELNELAWKHVRNFYKQRNREISNINKLQAHLPTKCICLPNKVGTASGMWFENNNQIIISMPGVPREMKLLITDEVNPRLKEKFTLPIIIHQFINTVGIPESDLAEKLENWIKQLPKTISLAFLPSLGSVKLRLTIKGENKLKCEQLIANETEKCSQYINSYIYSTDENSISESIHKLLIDKKLTISTAESCTGGNIAKTLTSNSGSSAYFIGSVVSYANEAKINELNANVKTIEKYGAVSEKTAIEMVKGVQNKFNTDIAISTTGIAGPDGGTDEKPVGTVWIAIYYKEKITTKLLQIGDLGRKNNIENTTIAALNLIRKTLNKN